MAAHCTTNIQS
uniref:Uncharacterized protein n=1 Tax=Arundo donax TaxID=35708 RepID=A0A0A8YUR6_ARUDO